MYKIVVFTAEDNTFLFNAWCDFVEKAKKIHQITAIFVFPDILKNKKGLSIYFEYIKILGFFDFFILVFKTLIYRFKTANKKYKNFSDLGEKNNIPVFYKNNPNDADVVHLVKNDNTDVILITFGYIVKQPLLDAVRIAILNKHSSILPLFRGIWPVFWILNDGSAPLGVTVHKVEKKIDGGEIILQKSYGQIKAKSVFDCYDIIYRDMADIFLTAIDNLESGMRNVEKADGVSGYYSLPTRAQYKEFKNKGLKFC